MVSVERVEAAIRIPRDEWGARCHEISLAMVRTMFAPGEARVARGVCDGVGGQHSWVVTSYDVNDQWHVAPDCYDPSAPIVDPTLWWYLKDEPQVWAGTLDDGRHSPHGVGSIWKWGRPPAATGEPVTLTPRVPWSDQAQRFLRTLGPLDREGWIMLAHAPVEFWPSAEIIDALCESGFEGYVPIDIVGMLTDRNPCGLYLREPV